jgi:preprotein translocase subunit SecY
MIQQYAADLLYPHRPQHIYLPININSPAVMPKIVTPSIMWFTRAVQQFLTHVNKAAVHSDCHSTKYIDELHM